MGVSKMVPEGLRGAGRERGKSESKLSDLPK